MKIGYPCINTSIDCTANRTFRLGSYSKERLIKTAQSNLDCLKKILEYNKQNNLLFFRIGSSLIPFASHSICKFDWQNYFKNQFREIGDFIIENNFRIGMHPDQFVVINSTRSEIIENSIKEIEYHCDVLDLMGLDETAKIQIHIGGVYGDKDAAMKRFVENYEKLSEKIKKRLVIENDHRSYSLEDCLAVSKKTGIPIVLDLFHHMCLSNGESRKEAICSAMKTWRKKDGVLMVDYSSQKLGGLRGSHAESIDLEDFQKLLKETKGLDFDVMLEIKDKEKSALRVIK
ncbi:MAG: UV DNA damage repair endonuclease UvsE [Patescibacteria group bacterium]